jgi:hypothetical protein
MIKTLLVVAALWGVAVLDGTVHRPPDLAASTATCIGCD